MSKFKVGELWKNRDGDKCIILEVGDGIRIYYYDDEEIINLSDDGLHPSRQSDFRGYDFKGYDLIEPWKEPETKEVYVHWWDNGKMLAKSHPHNITVKSCTPLKAIKKVTLTEGEFDD